MLYTSLNLDKSLEFATFCIRVVLAVGDDDVVHEEDTHQFAGPLDAAGQFIVGLAGGKVARGMVVADGEDSRIGEHSLTDDDSDIDGCLRDATM